MPAERLMPTQESADLIELTRSIVDKELRPLVDEAERAHAFHREAFTTLGRAGLLSLPYPEEYGGGGQPYEVYLQVLEEIAAAWAAVGVGVSVHALSCFGLFHAGTEEQKERWLPDMLGGELLGALLPVGGARGLRPGGDAHPGGARRGRLRDHRGEGLDDARRRGRLLQGDGAHQRRRRPGHLLLPGARRCPGLSADAPEDKMGLMSSPTTTMLFDEVRIPAERRLGAEGQGLPIALAGLDSGRLGIAAVATGVAQGALDVAVRYAKERESFGRPIIDHQGLAFLLADMAAAVESARATYLYAARLRDAGRPFSRQASIAKMVATDNAMRVTTDAVQVLGGAGYTRDFPVERYMRETKVMQIFEGTNQIQRLVISRDLARD